MVQHVYTSRKTPLPFSMSYDKDWFISWKLNPAPYMHRCSPWLSRYVDDDSITVLGESSWKSHYFLLLFALPNFVGWWRKVCGTGAQQENRPNTSRRTCATEFHSIQRCHSNITDQTNHQYGLHQWRSYRKWRHQNGHEQKTYSRQRTSYAALWIVYRCANRLCVIGWCTTFAIQNGCHSQWPEVRGHRSVPSLFSFGVFNQKKSSKTTTNVMLVHKLTISTNFRLIRSIKEIGKKCCRQSGTSNIAWYLIQSNANEVYGNHTDRK